MNNLVGPRHPPLRNFVISTLVLGVLGIAACGSAHHDPRINAMTGPNVGRDLDDGEHLGSIGTLVVKSTKGSQHNICPDVFELGDTVRITGRGFAPGSEVRITEESDRLRPLGATLADGTGRIAVDFAVPRVPAPGRISSPDVIDTNIRLLARGQGETGGTYLAIGQFRAADNPVVCDMVRPSVAISVPTRAAVYELDEKVLVDYECSDLPAVTGLYDCVGNLRVGEALDTSLPGQFTFKVVAHDKDGNFTEATRSYEVRFPRR